MTERPLVAFTLLAQTAVGAFLTLGAVILSGGAMRGDPVAVDGVDRVLLAVGPVMAAALAVSLLHLGSPGAAWRAVRNVRRSWLSREILLALVFTACGAAFGALRSAGRGPVGLRTGLAVAAALAGVALVYAMARVYRIRTVAAWNTPRTTVSFFASALLLGTLAAGTGLVLLARLPDALVAGPRQGIALAAAAGFGVNLALPGHGAPHRVRRALLVAGLAACAGALLAAPGRATPALVAAFVLALAAQVLGRYLFYVDGLRREL